MKQKLYYRGSVVQVSFKVSRPKENRTYMLVESFQQGIAFQLVCIDGYKGGVVYGEIREDEIASMLNCLAVTEQHLIEELIRINGPYYKKTLKIYTKDAYRKRGIPPEVW